MPKTVSATEAKVHLGAMLEWAAMHADGVVIESRGRPRAVLLDFAEYQRLQTAGEAARRQDALRRLEALAGRVAARNADLDEQEAAALSDRFVREAAADLDEERPARARRG